MRGRATQKEIEVKYVKVNHNNLRKKLVSLGAKCTRPLRLMIRQTFDVPNAEHYDTTFVRVRNEGDKTTMTYKEFLSKKDVNETELVVNGFEQACDFCARVGLTKCSYQESRRETWKYRECEIALDEWPWLQPYIEIEGPSTAQIKQVSEELGFIFSRGVYGDVTDVYRTQYSHLPEPAQIGILPEIKFRSPLPDFLNPKIKLSKYTK